MIIISNDKNVVPINENLNVEIYDVEKIKQKIYTIRGKQVMIDSDAAKVYHCETKYVNRAVKRNIERFPEEFCFQLTEEEYNLLKLQIKNLNLKKGNMR